MAFQTRESHRGLRHWSGLLRTCSDLWRPQQPIQLDKLFEDEIRRSNVPFHDFSFLGDLVDGDSESLDDPQAPCLPETAIAPPVAGLDDHVQTLRYTPTSIPRFSQEDDKLSGSDSSGATLASAIHTSKTKHPQLSSDLNFEWLVQAAKHIAKFDSDATMELSSGQLPPKSLAAICVNAYFDNVQAYYPILREHQFQASWESLYDRNQKTHRVAQYILFCLVLTIGAASDGMKSAFSSPLDQFSCHLFQKACALVYVPMTESSLVALQVMLLLVRAS
ncbi:hypothetical protein PV08_08753 [Exophiala spinifera]|uniref:Transcription factor domain-containing protein n=1 Tax=Exophiala spinifera TaxID=91928 RepID=A0A0D2B4G7_9EURO|nr:uncharacterized protein PV08_08753 [Exophiala spinifera]KIW13565.1 hypothetical protein PV08_08753 [Exophiala spinifera]